MERKRGFEIAKGFEDKNINLPVRKTKYSWIDPPIKIAYYTIWIKNLIKIACTFIIITKIIG